MGNNTPTKNQKEGKHTNIIIKGFPSGSAGKESAGNVGDLGSIPGLRRSPEKEMATHSNILTWEIPWTEEPGGLQSMGLQKTGHNWVTTHTDRMEWLHVHTQGIYIKAIDSEVYIQF